MTRSFLTRVMQLAGLLPVLCFSFACGGGGGSVPPPPPAPTVPSQVVGLAANSTAGSNALSWTAAAGATSYQVSRADSSAGPYTVIATPSSNSYADTAILGGLIYDYQVAAVNAVGTGAASTPLAVQSAVGSASVQISVDALANRHPISPLVYGVNFPPNAAYINDSGTTFVRWGGNNSTGYNWKNFDCNLDNDWFFQDSPFQALGLGNSNTGTDSLVFTQEVVAAGADPLMTMPMLITTDPASGLTAGWVAKGGGQYYSFSESKYKYTACVTDYWNSDIGDGILTQPACDGQTSSYFTPSNPVYVSGNAYADAYVPLLDSPSPNDPPGAVYRSQWAAALAPAYGSAPHFYDLDNEPDIWNGTHRDVHPQGVTYRELSNDFVDVARTLKQADPAAITFGPVSCCWGVYWNSTAGTSDKQAHGNLDFWPWWLNDVAWEDRIVGLQLLNVFDFHAYPETSVSSGASAFQLDALSLAATRDWWDTAYADANSWIGGADVTAMQPLPHVQARLVRALALANSILPGLPVSVSEWNFGLSSGLVNEDSIATALSDLTAWGLLGQYDYYAAARWTAPDPSKETASYEALKLFRNYDGQHHAFASISVAAANNCAASAGEPYLCSSFAAVSPDGTQMTLLVINNSPYDALTASLELKNFTAASVASYRISAANPNQITASSPAAFSPSQTFPPYSATLLVISGSMPALPAADWALNPSLAPATTTYAASGTIMVSAGTTAVIHPALVTGAGPVTLTGVTADSSSGITFTITQPTLTAGQNGALSIGVPASTTPGFYNYTVTGKDAAGIIQTQAGIVEAGNPAATLSATGNGQTAAPGSTLTLSVTVAPGSSGANAAGQDLMFTASAGTLAAPSGTVAPSTPGSMLLVTTDANGTASVKLTLPATPGAVTVTAEAPYPLGHPTVTFTETAQ